MNILTTTFLAASALALVVAGAASAEPIQVKVFVGSMFEIGENTGRPRGRIPALV